MYVRVRVTPNARKESVVKAGEREYDIRVKEKAERNRANRRVLELLSVELGVPLSAIRIANGHRSPLKLIRVEMKQNVPRAGYNGKGDYKKRV